MLSLLRIVARDSKRGHSALATVKKPVKNLLQRKGGGAPPPVAKFRAAGPS
jgi:hypothetical protein